MPPKFDPFATHLKDIFQYETPEDDGMTTRQRLKAKRKQEGRDAYEKQLPLREANSTANSVMKNPYHQQLDPRFDKPVVNTIIGGAYYEPKKQQRAVNKGKLTGEEWCGESHSCPTCGHHDGEQDNSISKTETVTSTTTTTTQAVNRPSQAPEEISTQTKEWHRMPFPTDDRQANFKLGPKPVSVQTTATGHTVRSVGCEVNPTDLFVERKKTAWERDNSEQHVVQRPMKGVQPEPRFLGTRTIQTETSLSGHNWAKDLKLPPPPCEEQQAEGAASNENTNSKVEIASEQRPPSSVAQRYQSRPDHKKSEVLVKDPNFVPPRPSTAQRFESRPWAMETRKFLF